MAIKGKKALLIINPRAGRQSAKTNLFKIIEILSEKYTLTVHLTKSAKDTAEIAAMAGEFDTVICCGGDGTLSQTVAGLLKIENPPPVGYMPTGTANDVASTLNISRDIAKSAKCAVEGTPTPHDVGLLNNTPFVYVASFGTFTKASYSTPQEIKNIFGQGAYILTGVSELSKLCDERVTVTIDGVSETFDNITLLLINNTASIGGIAKLSKDDYCLDDGKFELILIKKPNDIVEMNNLFFSMVNTTYKDSNVIVKHISKAEIKLDHPVAWTIDGELAGNYDKVNVEVLNKAIKIIR